MVIVPPQKLLKKIPAFWGLRCLRRPRLQPYRGCLPVQFLEQLVGIYVQSIRGVVVRASGRSSVILTAARPFLRAQRQRSVAAIRLMLVNIVPEFGNVQPEAFSHVAELGAGRF